MITIFVIYFYTNGSWLLELMSCYTLFGLLTAREKNIVKEDNYGSIVALYGFKIRRVVGNDTNHTKCTAHQLNTIAAVVICEQEAGCMAVHKVQDSDGTRHHQTCVCGGPGLIIRYDVMLVNNIFHPVTGDDSHPGKCWFI